MLKANTRPVDDQRAALAILGFMRGDTVQLDYVMGEAAADPTGPARLIVALTEAAANFANQATDDAEQQIAQIVLDLEIVPE